MGITAQRVLAIASLLALSVTLAFTLGWFDFGYGKVSEQAYEFSKALYSACLNRNDEHLGKVERLLAETGNDSLSAKERQWLEGICQRARAGQWEVAARYARRMMDDQVEY